MKKIKYFCSICLLVACCCVIPFLTGCGETHTIRFMDGNPNYDTILEKIHITYRLESTITVAHNDIIGDESPAPMGTKYSSNWRFLGWYTSQDGTDKWDLYRDEVKSDMTLYAIYEKK
ncbi:MAG: InlB B-repeat-containing protein [Clostridia bacterium]|nr:InlB B-repeat-containing protein [Clostridia bacterium]